jgi:hypothetical protein
MAAMARLNLSIPVPQIVWLQAEAERLGISAGELVRRIIDQHRETQGLHTHQPLKGPRNA